MDSRATATSATHNHKSNRLINETSTYLLQHAYNPVDWYPWGPEALQRAKQENKPILLSVGYSACHWCHVMEKESFEDEQTAQLMNKLFINIKVDREERPDIDEIYMKAVQMLTGHGGWPMTVFMTPDLKPFFGGTYFPPQDKHGMPSFKRLLLSVDKAWQEQREEVEASSQEITQHLAMFETIPEQAAALKSSLIEQALQKITTLFDKEYGGFGGAPKFPHSGTISLCQRYSLAHKSESHKQNLQIVTTTLNKMACGGIYDQIGGGFARYSVDKTWLVPHFEKMLYDNALLARNYLEGFQSTGNTYWARVGKGILDFVLRELTTADGAFYSSLDADSEGEEGKFYVWHRQEILELLGNEDGHWLSKIYGCSEQGNFEHNSNILHLSDTPEQLAQKHNLTIDKFWQRLDELNSKLLAARQSRTRPGRDEKVLTSWNALMLSAFVDGYRILQEPKYLQSAKASADFILANLYVDKTLLRTWGRGQAKLNGYLEDYSYLVQALLDLSTVDFDPKWLSNAINLNKTMLELFSDDRDGSLFFTSSEHEQLITRTKNFFDGSMPSATAIAINNLLRLGRLTGQAAYTDRATTMLSLYSPLFLRAPEQFAYQLCALDFHLSAASEIALLVDQNDSAAEQVLFSIHQNYLPNTIIALQNNSNPTTSTSGNLPLLQLRTTIADRPTVYICSNYACQQPLTESNQIKERLESLSKSAIV